MQITLIFALIAVASAGQTFIQELAAQGITVGAHGPVAVGGLAGPFHAAPIHAGPVPLASASVANSGSSVVKRAEDGLGNYQFAYQEQGLTGGSARSESGDAYGRVRGSYSLGVIDGRERRVDYVADEHGFRAQIATNEQGTAAEAPADVSILAAQSKVVPVAVAQPVLKSVAVPKVLAQPVVEQSIFHQPIVQQPIVQQPIVQQPIVQQLAAPVKTVVAAPALPIVQKVVEQAPIHIPQPVSYSSVVSHLAPAPIAVAPHVQVAKTVLAPKIIAQAPIVQQLAAPVKTVVAAPALPIVQQVVEQAPVHIPQPVSYSSVVSHLAPAKTILAPKIVAQAPIVQQHIESLPVQVTKTLAAPVAVHQPIVQQQLAIPQPIAYKSVVSHAAPVALNQPYLKSVVPQYASQHIVKQAVTVPQPMSYSSVVSHIVPAAPQVHYAKTLEAPVVSQQIVQQPIVQQSIAHEPIIQHLALPKPIAYTNAVSHVARAPNPLVSTSLLGNIGYTKGVPASSVTGPVFAAPAYKK